LYHTKYYYRKEVCYKSKEVPYIHKEVLLIRNKYYLCGEKVRPSLWEYQ